MNKISPALVEAARTGCAADVERLLQAVWPDAYRLALAVLGQPQSAEDAAQEACVSIMDGITALRRTDAFTTWTYRIVVREALKQKRFHAYAQPLDRDAAYTQDAASSLDVWRAIAALPAHLRIVVVLHYFENLSSREIGRILRIPGPTVRFRLMTAKRRMLPMLAESQPAQSTKGEGIYAL